MTGDTRLLMKFHFRVIKIAATVLLVAELLGGVVQLTTHNRLTGELEQAVDRRHFYSVIAGAEHSSTATPDIRLAEDLRSLLGPTVPEATALPEVIEKFQGNANSYGGVTDAIGFDPFADGLGCYECGPLNATIKHRLLLIKQGRLSEVIAKEASTPVPGYTFTPFGWSVVFFLAMLWIVGGSIALFIGYLWAHSLDELRVNRFSDIDWGRKNVNTKVITFFAPGLIAYLVWRRVANRGFQKQVRARFGYLLDEIEEIDKDLRLARASKPDDADIKALSEARDEAVRQLESITRSRENISLEQVRERLYYVTSTLEARKELQSGGEG